MSLDTALQTPKLRTILNPAGKEVKGFSNQPQPSLSQNVSVVQNTIGKRSLNYCENRRLCKQFKALKWTLR